MPVAMPGMSGMKNKKEAMGRLARSKVSVPNTPYNFEDMMGPCSMQENVLCKGY